eukprot:15464534-Alexandrium_andersonii.AAC.1
MDGEWRVFAVGHPVLHLLWDPWPHVKWHACGCYCLQGVWQTLHVGGLQACGFAHDVFAAPEAAQAATQPVSCRVVGSSVD